MIEKFPYNPIESESEKSLSEIESDAEKFGTKFAVQKLFYKLGMCGIDTRLFEPETPVDEIEKTLGEMEATDRGFTIRFSYKNALNLPRGFLKTPQECLDFIKKVRKDYAIIVQEYTRLINSFELYYDGNVSYLQVLPGIWEVDATEAPDIVQKKNNEITIWRFRQPREAKLINNENKFYKKKRDPFTFVELQEFYKRLEPYKDRLEIVRKIFNPLFCHFYEDDKGRFCFINLRNVGGVPINEGSPSAFHVVKDISDIEKWDGNLPILFDVQTERDKDAPLIETIKALRDKEIKSVFVNYGILSHPAILLREAGIQVQQSYQLYEKQVIPTQKDDIEIGGGKVIVVDQIEQVEVDETYKEIDPRIEQELHDTHIISLNQITEEDARFVGGKAYNLSKIAKAGFLIPRGFVVTTYVFKKWAENACKLDADISDKISKAFQLLELENVAVRSSSTVEDLSQASSAGVYKTSLNIKRDEVVNAIIEGFKSFYEPNAQIYRSEKSIERGADMAIIVQEMINARISGVLFTRNPLNPDTGESEFVINATFGLGEPLVSGRVSGDTFVIDKEKKLIKESTITQKNSMLTKDGEVSVPESIRSGSALNNSQIDQLIQIGKEIEVLFGAPQDIEFAITHDKIWILQSRPITKSGS